MMAVLILGADHCYYQASVRVKKVVYNTKTKSYSEYFGDEYLEENEIVKEMEVAE